MKTQGSDRKLARARVVALLLAGLCSSVLYARVYDDFERQRFLVVTTEHAPSQGAVTVRLPDLTELSGQPTAIVLRLTNNAPAEQLVRIAIGDLTLADTPLATGQSTRVDLSLPDGVPLSSGNLLEITGRGDAWSLTYLEVANSHGFTQGLIEFVIVPASAHAFNRVVLPAVLLLVLVLYWLATTPAFRRVEHTVARTAHVVVGSLVLVFLTALLLAPVVSDYEVLLAPHSFLLCVVLLYFPALAPILLPVITGTATLLRWMWTRRIPLLYAVSIGMFLASVARFYEPGNGFTSFIHFGDRFESRALPAVRYVPHHVLEQSSGYDGQFYAQLAVDPFLRDPATRTAVDAPAYRARRILFSLTAYLFGLGQPRYILHVYAIQNMVFWFLLALLLCRWFPPRSLQNLCLWFGCMFSHGLILSVTSALPDGPSMLLLALAMLALERGRPILAAGLMGMAGLAKDINLLWAAALPEAPRRDWPWWRSSMVLAVMVAGPVCAWTLYVHLVAGGGLQQAAGHGNFAAPLTGFVTKWGETLSAVRDEGLGEFPRAGLFAMIGITVQALVLSFSGAWRNPWGRAGIASCVLMLFLGPAVWGVFPVPLPGCCCR